MFKNVHTVNITNIKFAIYLYLCW